jgi:hypothetical protein
MGEQVGVGVRWKFLVFRDLLQGRRGRLRVPSRANLAQQPHALAPKLLEVVQRHALLRRSSVEAQQAWRHGEICVSDVQKLAIDKNDNIAETIQ